MCPGESGNPGNRRRGREVKRRQFITATAATLAGARLTLAEAVGERRYRAAVIGHTGRGNYGHGWDTVFNHFDSIEVVAVADPDDQGRKAAVSRTGASRGYRDYREMLEKEQPQLVSIGPRWLDQRLEMVTAAAQAGAHIILEKPFARNLIEADAMVHIVEENGVKLQVGHGTAISSMAKHVFRMLREGEIGVLQEIRTRGKEDRRAGGEDLMVLGSHLMHLIRMFGGDPQWVSAHVTGDNQELHRGHVHEASELLGPVGGDQVAAMFYLGEGLHAYFASKANDVHEGDRFGMYFYGSKGIIFLPTVDVKGPAALRSRDWHSRSWEAIELPGQEGVGLEQQAALLLADLVGAIEENRDPLVSARDGRWTIEMILSIYQSQKTGTRVNFPLVDRRHPLENL